MVWVKMWVNRLTHTLTHTRIGLKSTGEEAFAFSPVFLVLFCSHDLRHEAAHRLCGLVLLLPCGVGVGAECESSVIVAEHTADGFDVHAILQCQRCEGMSEIMKADMLQSCVLEDFLMKVYHRVWVVHFSCSAGREHPRIVRVLGVLLLQ